MEEFWTIMSLKPVIFFVCLHFIGRKYFRAIKSLHARHATIKSSKMLLEFFITKEQRTKKMSVYFDGKASFYEN